MTDALKALAGKMTLLEFRSHMMAAYIANAGLQPDDAAKHATELLPALGIKFGDPDYDWTKDAAIELVRDDISQWDW